MKTFYAAMSGSIKTIKETDLPCTACANKEPSGNTWKSGNSAYNAKLKRWEPADSSITCEECVTANEGVLIYADSILEALRLAELWDNNKIQLKNVPTDRGTVGCLSS